MRLFETERLVVLSIHRLTMPYGCSKQAALFHWIPWQRCVSSALPSSCHHGAPQPPSRTLHPRCIMPNLLLQAGIPQEPRWFTALSIYTPVSYHLNMPAVARLNASNTRRPSAPHFRFLHFFPRCYNLRTRPANLIRIASASSLHSIYQRAAV